MDEFKMRRTHVPAFGSWDCAQDNGFTQCFESARQPGIFRYSYSEDRDLYVAGDLYENDVVTPAVIVVPRRREKVGYSKEKLAGKDGWKVCNCDCDLKASAYPAAASPTPPYRRPPKAVDEDLYRISPKFLRTSSKRVGPLKPRYQRIDSINSTHCTERKMGRGEAFALRLRGNF